MSADPDWDLVVIGAGPAGLVAARGAVALGARVALVERHALGGDCLNVGCVPSKTLLRSARARSDLRNVARYGVSPGPEPRPDLDAERFGTTMRRLHRVRARIARADSAEELEREGIALFRGAASFADARTVEVAGHRLRFARAIVATGARQKVPDIDGLVEAGYLDVARAFELEALPRRLMVVGGGPLGTELGQAFRRLGAAVVLVHDEAKFLPREERDAAQLLSDSLARDGVEIHLDTRAVDARRASDGVHVGLVAGGRPREEIVVDAVLAGIGRTADVESLGLGRAGIDFAPGSGIRTDDRLRTTNPRVWAAGDVCSADRYTHVADALARIALGNALFGLRRRASRLVIPWCTYTDPEIAHVGLNVDEAARRGVAVKTWTVLLHEVDRAITDAEEPGFVKIHVRAGTDRIVGATIVARHAGEMINEITLAMQRGIGLAALSDVVHCYPTQAMAIKRAADRCAADRAGPMLRNAARRWLAWRRRG